MLKSDNSLITLRSSANKDLYVENSPYKFTNQLCTTLNYKNKSQVALAELHLPMVFRKDKTQLDINQLFVLCDIVDDTIVGSNRLNILKVVTVDKFLDVATSQWNTFENLFFYPLTRNSVNNIRIKIVTSMGKDLAAGTFTDVDETFVVLKFK
jgi:hypothetical protein